MCRSGFKLPVSFPPSVLACSHGSLRHKPSVTVCSHERLRCRASALARSRGGLRHRTSALARACGVARYRTALPGAVLPLEPHPHTRFRSHAGGGVVNSDLFLGFTDGKQVGFSDLQSGSAQREGRKAIGDRRGQKDSVTSVFSSAEVLYI